MLLSHVEWEMDGQPGEVENITIYEHPRKQYAGREMGRNSNRRKSIMLFCSVYRVGECNVHLFILFI
jgi:hypothetical protein